MGSLWRFLLLFCMLLLWLSSGVASALAFSANSSSFLCPHDESSALLGFLKSFSKARTTNLKSTWKEDTDCCLWDGVSCDLKTGHVISLWLPPRSLQGRIDSNNTLFSLHHLQELDLSFNDLIGPIPLGISHLSKLVSLDLSSNKNLSIDRVTFDRLAKNLTHLEDLSFDKVDMSLITPKSFSNVSSSLTSLSLLDCGLNGRLLDNFFQKHSSLQSLFLPFNEKLTGSLISMNQSDLQYLELSHTGISITLTEDVVNNLKSLTKLSVSGCNFEESSDLSQLNKLTQLQFLDLSSNNLSRQFPFSISIHNLTQLDYLAIFNNRFTGRFLNNILNLTKLSYLTLYNNLFHGHIPSYLGNLNQLTWLDLSDNKFTGSIPDSIGSLSQLSWLDMSNNNFSGQIPSSLSNLKSLSSLNLSFNSFSGSIRNHAMISLESENNHSASKLPSNLTKLLPFENDHFLQRESPFCLPSLTILSLANNYFSGEIDGFLCSKSLLLIDLSHNKFYGSIPTSVFALANLTILFLSSNNLSGELSSSICRLKSLMLLSFLNNNITGSIPSCLGSFSNDLLVLNLGMNKFQGMIPSTFSKGSALEYISFYGNELSGKIPLSLVNCKSLEFLNLGSNKINDTFPSFLETLPKLQVLVLRSNELHGSLTRSDPEISFPELRILDLQHNNLNGDLPNDYFDMFQAMKRVDENMTYIGSKFSYSDDYSAILTSKGVEFEMTRIQTTLRVINLSGNKFSGQIPQSIGELLSLKQFNISSNKFDDLIPLSIGNLLNLESLDLSCNLLSGRIPPQLLKLTFLEVLNLSFNKLEGPIPLGNQFNTFGNSSFQGNLGLCGFPLTKSCDDDERLRRPVPVKVPDLGGKFGFGWLPVVVGYGCGLIVGITKGYFVFKTRRPAWLMKIIEDYAREILTRRKRNAWKR